MVIINSLILPALNLLIGGRIELIRADEVRKNFT
jgi:hypothetical protein